MHIQGMDWKALSVLRHDHKFRAAGSWRRAEFAPGQLRRNSVGVLLRDADSIWLDQRMAGPILGKFVLGLAVAPGNCRAVWLNVVALGSGALFWLNCHIGNSHGGENMSAPRIKKQFRSRNELAWQISAAVLALA